MMEVRAAAEFASEEELNDSNYEQNEQSDDSDKDYETDSDAESGEIDTTQSETETQTEEDEQQIDETDQEVLASPCAKRKKKKSRRSSVEARLDTMSSTLLAMKELMVKNGLTGELEKINRKSNAGKSDHISAIQSSSETTIYKNALEKQVNPLTTNEIAEEEVDSEITFRVNKADISKLRESSSSEDPIDTSDEMMDIDVCNVNENFIADCKTDVNQRKHSYSHNERETTSQANDREVDFQEQTDAVIRQEESAKARILATPGKSPDHFDRFLGNSAIQHSSMVDENYLTIGGNLDPSMREKIIKGEYIDFTRLLPRSKGGCF